MHVSGRLIQSFRTGFRNQINDLLVEGCFREMKLARSTIHTRAVQDAIGSRRPNGVLSTAAPDVDKAEVNLPRVARITSAQLRS